MNVLVTGGAGYVGSIVVEELLDQGHRVVVLDTLQQGHRDAVLPAAQFVKGDIGNASDLERAFGTVPVDAVMHIAAETVIEFSMTDPGRYFRNNIAGGLVLLDTMLKHNVKNIIFSSSAAAYGEPMTTPMDEDHPTTPINSYGESKLMFERILFWYGRAWGIRHVSFRYFNAAGASDLLGEDHRPETHLIPNVLKALLDKGRPLQVFGIDYPTRDRSCVRDYVHVRDIAAAHVLALTQMDSLQSRAFNLGNGEGCSVLEIVGAVERVTGKKVPVELRPRRPGDPAVLVASSGRAGRELGWTPRFPSPDAMIESAWKWLSKHPRGYER